MSESPIGSYATTFDESVVFIQRMVERKDATFIKRVEEEYPCKHDPCCFACYFSSVKQTAFEEEVSFLVGRMMVDLTHLSQDRHLQVKYDHLSERLNHFLMSPKYPVFVKTHKLSSGGELLMVYLKLDEAMSQASRYVQWKLSHENKTKTKSVDSLKLSGLRRSKHTRSPVGENCRETCNVGTYRTEVPQSIMVRKSMKFERRNISPLRFDQSSPVLPTHETGGSLDRVVAHNTGVNSNPQDWDYYTNRFGSNDRFSTEALNRVQAHHTGYRPSVSKSAMRNTRGGSRRHTTDASVPLVQFAEDPANHSSSPLRHSPSDIGSNEGEPEPIEDLQPLESIRTGYSIGGTRMAPYNVFG